MAALLGGHSDRGEEGGIWEKEQGGEEEHFLLGKKSRDGAGRNVCE